MTADQDTFVHHCWQIQDLLPRLEFDDFTHEEAQALVGIFGAVYGCKIAGEVLADRVATARPLQLVPPTALKKVASRGNRTATRNV